MKHLASASLTPIASPVLAALVCLGLCSCRTPQPSQAARLTPPQPSPRDLPAVDDLPPRHEDPDPLTMMDGTPVTTKDDWFLKRRPQIVRLVQHYFFGYAAPERLKQGTPPPTLVAEDPDTLDGAATWQHLRVPLAPDPDVYKDLYLLIPNTGDGPFPTILTFGAPGRPNPKALATKDKASLDPKEQGPLRDAAAAMRRGYAIAAFRHNQSSDNLYTRGIYPHYQPTADGPLIDHPFGARRLHDWGEIAAWSWCARRIIDVLEHDKRIDPHRIAIMGGSRTGPAAILTAVIDQRIAAVIAWQISPFRWREGEGPMQGAWAYWIGTAYSPFDQHRDRMPVEYTCFAAAVAPRPMLLTASPTAGFADPDKTAWIANGAAHAYRFLGCDVADFKPPWTEFGLRGNGPLRMHLRGGGHAYHPDDWPAYLDFLDEHVKPHPPQPRD